PTGAGVREILEDRIRLWLDDPESSVEYAEEVEGRWAVRMRQETRDATTVWFDIGERSVSFEAYVLPAPDVPEDVHRQALVRNTRAWRCFFAVDPEGAVVLRGRLAANQVTVDELDRVLGEIYETIEFAFRPMVRAAFPGREKSG
ncbi:MAG TPA: YbjN domain-containing protein, partial [Rubrobacter sp.]|nr:YbjN domain-containing protein [Rubrobacter sp.]